MPENIYYVGAEQQHTTNRYTDVPQLRINKTSRIYLRGLSYKEKVNNSKSTSCPKTERSRYAITLQRLRNKSPKIKADRLNMQKLRQELKKESKILTIRNASHTVLSSAFHQKSIKQIIKEKAKGGKLFKKVQQPRFRQRGTIRIPNEVNLEKQRQADLKENQAKAGNRLNSNQIFKKSSKKVSWMPNQISLQYDEHYQIQHLRKLFLCNRCYQFTPIIQITGHHLSCQIPLKKQDFVHKWLKVINLLKEIFRQNSNNELYHLIDRMEWYISECNVGYRQGQILYSPELACVLSLKSTVKLNCVNVDDLFCLIETIGDLIQTKSIDLQETAFWNICE